MSELNFWQIAIAFILGNATGVGAMIVLLRLAASADDPIRDETDERLRRGRWLEQIYSSHSQPPVDVSPNDRWKEACEQGELGPADQADRR